MNRNLFWKLVLILGIVAWSFYEMYPPTGRDLVEYFQQHARTSDATLSNIVFQARALQKDHPERAFRNLQTAIGTNDIGKYFPKYPVKNELYPTTYILNRLQREAAGRIKLGIDLQGGTLFVVEMDTNRLATLATVTNKDGRIVTVTNQSAALEGAISQAVEVLRRRVDRFGVAEPIIQPEGNNRIRVQLPGLSETDRESAQKQIQRAAFLEFRLVHEQSDELVQALHDGTGSVPPGHELLKRKERHGGKETLTEVIVKKKAEQGLDGSIIKSAMVIRGNMGEPEIDFSLNSEGAKLFGEVTSKNIGRRLAIVLDGELYSAPKINGAIETGRGQITGNFELRDAFELANVLENPLKAPLSPVYSSDVDPTLGKDAIQSGIKASIYGVIAVAGFMLIYYMLAGLVANVALVTNIIILLGVMCSIGTTLTLPGIAGVVLTVGMAVDANVLIFERIREELAKGKSMRGALQAGYDRAFGTIFDSHVTTLISSIILIFTGTGPIKGFGVTLTIGVAASLFTALVVTRLIFDWMLSKNLLKTMPMLHIIRVSKLDFMRWAIPAFVASWMLILVGMGWGIHRGHGIFGVEFTGGESITFNFDQSKKVDVEQIRHSVEKLGLGESLIGYEKNPGAGTSNLRITVRTPEPEKAVANIDKKIAEQLNADFKDAKFFKVSGDKIGPSMGNEIRNTAVYASLLAMFGILVYVAFRYEFSFAVAAVVAIIHDILMTLGWYFLDGRELNSTTVAAILTIIGFSINDTIVIFDRIREDLKLGVRGTFREVVNQALNQTLSRTIITSGTVFLATFSLFIFGGGPVNDFAFTFLVGILTGTYSSIYIASAIVMWWHRGQRPNIGGSQVNVQGEVATAKA